MKTVLLTGVAGFIGFHTAKRLLKEGYRVVGLDNINDYYDVNLKFDRLAELGINKKNAGIFNKVALSELYQNFIFIRTTVEDRLEIPRLFENFGIDYVIHLAAQAGVRFSLQKPMSYVDSNLVGFVNILECCRHNHVKHLVFASSSSVYGTNDKVPFSEEDRVDHPISLYAATKKANELMAHVYSHLYNLPTTGLRFFTVYGPWGRPDMAPMLFAKAILDGQAIKVFNDGEMSRDFTFIDDIVAGILISLKNSSREGKPYQLFNIGNGSPVSLMSFIETLEMHIGNICEKIMLPMQPGDVPRTWADTTKLNALGYKSKVNISKGIKEFVEWYKDYYHNESA